MNPKTDTRARLLASIPGLVALLVLAGAPAAAEGPVRVELTAALISDQPGEIDPRGARIHAQLEADFRYTSLRVLEAKSLSLGLDEVGSMALPNGHRAQVRPLTLEGGRVLLAVDIGPKLKSDFKVQSGHLLLLQVGKYEDGRLVVAIEPRF